MSDWKMQRDEVERLIAAYKKLKCLWDFRSNEYKRYDLKKYSWQKLGKMFGKQAFEVKTKIKYLRSAYVSEKKKVDDSYGTGQIYQPTLFYYKDLNFLDSIIVCRKGPKFENFDHTNDLIAEENEHSSENTFNVHDEGVDDTIPAHPSLQRTTDSNLKIRKQQQQHRPAPYSKNDATTSPQVEVIAKTSSEDSIYMAFARTIALQLSQLPPLDATATMSEIHQILSNNIIKSMLMKKGQSYRARDTQGGNVDSKLSLLKHATDSKLCEDDQSMYAFEEISM